MHERGGMRKHSEKNHTECNYNRQTSATGATFVDVIVAPCEIECGLDTPNVCMCFTFPYCKI